MKPNMLEELGKKILNGLGNPIVVVILIILLLLVGIPVIYGYYHAWIIAPAECCTGAVHPVTHTEYGYYSVNDFLTGNELYLDWNGITPTNYYSGVINLTYYADNQTWVLQNPVNDVIPFTIHNPATGRSVKGIFTPNITITNDTFSTDILIVNWNDRKEDGSCYQVITLAYRGRDNFHILNEGPIEKTTGIPGYNQYDEIRMSVTPYKPADNTTLWDEDVDLRYRQDNSVLEKNCTREDIPSQGSWTNLAFVLERR